MTRRAWPPVIGAGLLAALAAVLLLRAGTEEVVAASALPPPLDPAAQAEALALQSLRARLRDPDQARFAVLGVWRYGPEDERAVCGTIASPELPGGTARFVLRVVLPEDGAALPADARIRPRGATTILEEGPGVIRPTPWARERFCRDAEAPRPEPVSAQAPPRPPVAATGTAMPPPPAAGGGARERVLVHSPANLRAGPGGGASVLSVVPRGRTLEVFDQAPGGWVRVGDGEPWGWIHASLLAGAPPGH